jgi:lipooligosaccharide transport system permease protein
MLQARGVAAMVARNRDVYLKTWKTNFLPPLLEPLLYLVAIGYGVGQLVPSVAGVSYAQFVAPGIVAITMMQSAFFETTYGSYVRMHFQKTWDAVTATPLLLADVLVGELAWSAIKSCVNAVIMAVVVAAFGLIPWSMLWPVGVVALVVGLVFGGIGLWLSARVATIDGFQFGIYLFVTPMMLFSGTFFPLDQLPSLAQKAALVLPLTHAVLVLRPLTLGSTDVPLASVAYLLGLATVVCILAVASMQRKLVR